MAEVGREAGRNPTVGACNARMPFTWGDNDIRASRVVGWCRNDHPLVEVAPVVPSDRDRTIAGHVVARIPDGATLQAGIGDVPDAVLHFLTDHWDLGIHTELVTDGFMNLIAATLGQPIA